MVDDSLGLEVVDDSLGLEVVDDSLGLELASSTTLIVPIRVFCPLTSVQSSLRVTAGEVPPA